MVGAWQKGQITWISDLWLVVGHTIILIDLAAPLIYVISTAHKPGNNWMYMYGYIHLHVLLALLADLFESV